MSSSSPSENESENEAKTAAFAHGKRRSALPRMVRRIIAVLLIAAAGLFVWTNRDSLSPAKIKSWVQENLLGYSNGDGYPVSFGGGSVSWGNFASADGTPALVSSKAFLYLSSGGKTLSLRQHGYSSPVLKRCGTHFLIYDLGNKSFRVSDNGTDFTENASYDYAIYTGAIAANGNYAIASASLGYTSQVSVFDKKGVKLFEWASQNYLISSVCFSPDGKRIAASAFTSDGGVLHTVISVFALDGSDALDTRTLDDCIVLDSVFLDEATIAAVGDTCAVRFSVGAGDLQSYDYGGQTLSTYDLDVQYGAALALSAASDARTGNIIALDTAFSASTVTHFTQAVISLDLYESGLLLLCDGNVSTVDRSGVTIGHAYAGSDAVRALALDAQSCYVLGISEVRICTLQAS